MSRYPLRIAGSIVGALTAIASGLVGSGLFTADQGNAVTGIITGLVTLLAAFGVVVSTEHKVTPLADPRNLSLIDELSVLLNKKLRVKVATLSQISDLLKKTEQSQRVLDEVTEGFTLDVVGDEVPGQVRVGQGANDVLAYRLLRGDAHRGLGEVRYGTPRRAGQETVDC